MKNIDISNHSRLVQNHISPLSTAKFEIFKKFCKRGTKDTRGTVKLINRK